MFASKIYFSLSEITDPTQHRAHNEWHMLDHRPENLMLPGIVWGDRWVRPPDCAGLSRGSADSYGRAHYAIMYWFREPLEETIDDFMVLSERSFQWGRSPQVGWTRRPMRGFFVPVKGYVAPRVGLSAEALPFRPVKGIQVRLSQVGRDADAQALFRWQDQTRIPQLLACPGVAGAWTFAAERLFEHPGDSAPAGWRFADAGVRTGEAVPDRLQILFLDEDPAEVLPSLPAAQPPREIAEEVLFDGPFRSIVAWEWDWFDGQG